MTPDLNDLVSIGIEGVFYILLGIFALHAIFLSYHWFSYGTSRRTSTIALGVYLIGGALFLIAIASTLFFI